MTLVAGRAGYRVGNDETGIDCPSQCGLIKGAWSQVFLVKLRDASTNIASNVDELRVARGPTPAYSSLTPQSNVGVPDQASNLSSGHWGPSLCVSSSSECSLS